MKKLLILAALLLALVVTVVACKGGETPEVTTGPDVDVTEPATGALTEEPTEEPTVEPDVPTGEPDVPTQEPDVPTQEPDVPTQEPDVPTQEPDVPTQEPDVPPVDPDAPLHVVEPDFLANYAAQTGNLVCVSDVASAEVKTEGSRTFIRLTAGGGDPYIAFIDGQKNLPIARYMVVSYRTNSTMDGQFFMGSGGGWTGQGDSFGQAWNEDGNWNLAIIDLDNVGITSLENYILNYARCDFFAGAGNDGDYFDIEYIAFFNTPDAAQKYDFEMHKAPMWGEAGFLANHSFDELDKYAGETKIEGAFTPGQSSGWNGVIELSDFSVDTLRYWGWVAGTGGLGQFGYQINGGSVIYNDAWTYPDPALEPYMPGGIDHFSRMQIWIPLAGLEGTNTIRTLYKNAEGQEACLAEFTVILPVTNLQNKFESNVNDNADGTDLQASDLSQYFTIMYGASDPHKVEGGLYQYGGINELYAYVDGYYAYVIDMQEAANTAMAFVRGTKVVHSVDLPEMDVGAGLYPINNYYETDGNGYMGGAGIYAAIYNGKLNLMIKAFTPDGRTHIANKMYSVKVEGTELTIADNGETVYFLVDGKLVATIALSGETEYEKLCDIAEGVKFAQTAVVTLSDGTTDTIENTLVVSTHKSELGIAVRPATIKFSSIKVLGFNDVVIPDEFYVPEVKENIALNKPVSADSTENDQNVPYKMTDGDETTRWGALPNGVANVVVDLKAVYTLSGMDILFENASWNYEIALSTDGENYTKIYDGAPHAAKMVSLEGTVDARYIKFTRTQDDGATHYWFSIYELYVYGTLKDGEVDPNPDQPEAPKNVVIDLSTIEGHQTSNNFGYDCPILTIGYDKVFFVGDIDLNQYSQIIIEYSYDGDTVVEGKPVEQNWTECGRTPIIGFTALNKSFGFANITNQDAIDNGIYTDLPYTPGTWAAASRTAVIEIPENIGYNGPCYLSAYNPWFREIAVSSITLVPRVVDEPDEPAKGEFVHASNDELRIMGTDNVTQIGQAFAPGQFDGWNKVLTLEEGSFGGLIDWGWVAVNSTAYEFGYIINGAEIFSPLFNGPADPNVDAAITAMGGNNGGRFLGMCAAQALIVGENNVKFAVKLDGGVTEIIREYTVIITSKAVEPDPDDPIGPELPDDSAFEKTNITLGLGGQGNPFNGGEKKMGQKFNVGENFLRGITIINMATYDDGNVNTWSVKVWKWNGDYATTVAGTPLYEVTGENHVNCQSFSVEIPLEAAVTGEVFYELTYLTGEKSFTGWTASGGAAEGVETYIDGQLKDGTFLSTITVLDLGKPLDPDGPALKILPDYLKEQVDSGANTSVQHVASGEIFEENGVTYIRLTTNGGDPYVVAIPLGSNYVLPQYMAVSYRTNSALDGHFFMGSGAGWSGAGDVFTADWIGDGEWHLAVIDLTTTGLTSIVDGKITYCRMDFFTAAGAAGDYFDVEFVAFFESPEKAEAYYAKTHAPSHVHSYEAVVTDPTCTEGGYTTYTCGCGDSYVADEVAAAGHNFVDGACGICGEADPDYVAPVAMPAEFVLSLYQANLGKTLYFKGAMDGYYFALSENSADAVKVYSEKVEGGYRMYFLDGDTKNYLDIVYRAAGKANVVITTEPVGVYVWNEDANTWTVTIDNDVFYLGTYNSFKTISASLISYITGNNAANVGKSQFVAQWADVPASHEHSYEAVVTDPTCTEGGYTTYTCGCGDTYVADEVAAAGHNFVDGACGICGEADPDYVNPDEPIGPEAPAGGAADFNTIETPGKPNGNSSYTGPYTTTDGWVIENSAIQAGGDKDSNPQFTVIGPDNTYRAPCLNGKTSAPGKITSPTLTGGISKLTINYTKMFTDTVLSVTITITDLSNGTTYTQTLAKEAEKDDKYTVWTYEWVLETPITGDFTIEIVNDCPTGQNSNKDRITILSIAWEGAVAEEPEAPAGEIYYVTTTDNYCFVDEYTFTATVSGTYTFTLPAGLSLYSLTSMNAGTAPEVDLYANDNGGATVTFDLAAGASYVFYVGATTKADWEIVWTVVEGEVSGGDEGGDEDGGEIVEDISGTYLADNGFANGTVVIDTMDATLVFTDANGNVTEYTFEITDGVVTLSNANGPINPAMASFFGGLELNANGTPSVFLYNGYEWDLTLGGGSGEPDEPVIPDVPADTTLVVGANTIVVTDEIITNGGVEYTFTVEAEGQYTFEGDFWVQIYNGFGMQVGMGSAFLSEGTYTVNLGTFLISDAGSYTLTVVYDIPEEPDQPDQPSGNTAIESLPFTYEVTAEGLDMDGVYYDYTATEEVTLIITKPEGGYVSLTATNNWSDDDSGNYILVVNAGETITLNFWSMSGITTGSFTVNVYVAEA